MDPETLVLRRDRGYHREDDFWSTTLNQFKDLEILGVK